MTGHLVDHGDAVIMVGKARDPAVVFASGGSGDLAADIDREDTVLVLENGSEAGTLVGQVSNLC